MADQALTLLLVEPDEVHRFTVRKALRQAAITAAVEECRDAESALAAIRAAGSRVPVVVLTSRGDAEAAVSLMKAGAADYVSLNELSPERLERSLRDALALHRDEEERRDRLARDQQALQDARAANRAKDEFLATLSHELRTPLNAILGWATLLAGGRLDEEATRRALEIIERNTRTQAQLIEDLLDVSRITTGKLRLECRVAPIRAVIDAAVDSVRHAADEKRIAIDIDAARAGDVLWCDPARMQQVIWNLLSNAIKFTPEGGRVAIRVERDDREFSVAVSDTGAGIDPDFLPHVFDRFRQQDAATARKHGGLGLGLSIVRHVVEMHGGTVHGSSKGSGHGSTFVVTIPVVPAPAHADVEPLATLKEKLSQFEPLALAACDSPVPVRPSPDLRL